VNGAFNTRRASPFRHSQGAEAALLKACFSRKVSACGGIYDQVLYVSLTSSVFQRRFALSTSYF
jgi:hypothetical protein